MKTLHNQHPWTAKEDSLLGTDTDAKIALRLGRTRGAVKARRFTLGIAPGRNDAPATTLEQLARNITAARTAAGLTQSMAAERAGFGIGEWQHYEGGTREPKALRVKAIAVALLVTADRLLSA